MKIKLLTLLTIGFASCCAWAEDTAAFTNAPPPFKGDKEKLSYAAGMSMGNYCKRQEVEVDLDKLMQGIRDVLGGGQTLLTEQQMRDVLMENQRQVAAKREEKRKQLAEENKKKADVFLAENKTKPGVVTLPSGLQYKVLTEGTGATPGSNDMVTVNYRGTLIDGTEFDNTYKRGQPVTFPIKSVHPIPIKGGTEALQLMKVGSKWELHVPPNLAYGEFGRPNIPPNSALIFEVELLTTAPMPAPAPARGTPLTSDVIKVPSLEEMKKGAKPETIKAEDLEKEVKKQEASEEKKQ
jgi:FKBP-type peptidyl-prolyl cis-trans isomerase